MGPVQYSIEWVFECIPPGVKRFERKVGHNVRMHGAEVRDFVGDLTSPRVSITWPWAWKEL
jgi:hypothetical protein